VLKEYIAKASPWNNANITKVLIVLCLSTFYLKEKYELVKALGYGEK